MDRETKVNGLGGWVQFDASGSKAGKFDLSYKELPAGSLAVLEEFPELEELDLSSSKFAGEALVAVAGLSRLLLLGLVRAKVSAEGLKPLNNGTLIALELKDCDLDDAAVPVLSEFKKLDRIELWHTKVTKEGSEKLKAALPNCSVSWTE